MKEEYTEITAENWEQFKGMEVQFRDGEDDYDLGILENFNAFGGTFPFETDEGDVFRYARIKNVQEVEGTCQLSECENSTLKNNLYCCNSFLQKDLHNRLEIPSNLTKAEAEEALKKASEAKVELNGWYLVEDKVSNLQSAMYLTEFKGDKGWEEHVGNGIIADFNDVTIISPMYRQDELNKLKEQG